MATAAKGVSLSLNLVTANVRLESVKNSEGKGAVAFSQGHDCGGGVYTKINQKRVCIHCDVEVEYDEIVSLRPIDGGFVAFTKDEVAELKASALVAEAKQIALVPHPASQVNSSSLPTGALYYVYPDLGCNLDAYHALKQEIQTRTDIAFCTVFSLRKGSEYMGRMTIVNDTLAIACLLWPSEIDYPNQVPISTTFDAERATKLMDRIVESSLQDFDPSDYTNKFRDVLAEVEKSRVPGEGGFDLSQVSKVTKKVEVDFFAMLEAHADNLEKPKKKKAKVS